MNLVLFLASFVLLTISSLSASRILQSSDHLPHHITSKQDGGTGNNSQQLSEKNETENENDFELEALALPFFITSYFQEIIPEPVVHTALPVAETTQHPIYVTIRNFRI